jgi:hypothetical protein
VTLLNILLGRYWEMIRKEVVGSTPEITAELDALEREIRREKAKP